jgi:hypothetical protein
MTTLLNGLVARDIEGERDAVEGHDRLGRHDYWRMRDPAIELNSIPR